MCSRPAPHVRQKAGRYPSGEHRRRSCVSGSITSTATNVPPFWVDGASRSRHAGGGGGRSMVLTGSPRASTTRVAPTSSAPFNFSAQPLPPYPLWSAASTAVQHVALTRRGHSNRHAGGRSHRHSQLGQRGHGEMPPGRQSRGERRVGGGVVQLPSRAGSRYGVRDGELPHAQASSPALAGH
jgi:hypothetical protein